MLFMLSAQDTMQRGAHGMQFLCAVLVNGMGNTSATASPLTLTEFAFWFYFFCVESCRILFA